MSQEDIKKLPSYDFNLEEQKSMEISTNTWLVKTGACPICRALVGIGREESSFSSEECKAEHSKLLVWVRMTDVPLEAWSIDGISALASSVGNPLITNNMTANMCHNGIGRMDFAIVLVEMDDGKEFKKEIEVQYRDGENKIKGIKKVNATYDWKPIVCTHCKVFGHDFNGCKKRTKTQEEIDMEKKRIEDLERGKKFESMEKTANKYSILESLPEDDPVEIRILKDRMIVDQYINKKTQPSVQEVKNWSQYMIGYFKEQWEKVRDKDKDSSENEEEEDDIMEELNELEGNVLANEITARDNSILHQ
nr:RNA-directed DNA polymerase, eukaryota, reverse transcriptase zinc-binding domain protein [Tanacetum cinerariifolium]